MKDFIKLALEQSKDAVVIFTNHLRAESANPQIIYANAEFLHLTQTKIEDVIHSSPCRFFGENTNQDLVKKITNTITSKKNWQSPFTMYSRDGHELFVYVKIVPVKDYKKDIMYYACFIQDMSVNDVILDMEEANQHLDSFVDAIFDHTDYISDMFQNVPTGLWRIDTTGKVLFINDVAKKDFHMEKGKNLFDMIHTSERKHIKSIFDSCKSSNKLNTIIFRLRHGDDIMWAECKYWPVVADKKITGFSGTAKDVTKDTLLIKQLEALKGKKQ